MDKISTRPWDSADHLKTEDDMADYFEACLQEAGGRRGENSPLPAAILFANFEPIG